MPVPRSERLLGTCEMQVVALRRRAIYRMTVETARVLNHPRRLPEQRDRALGGFVPMLAKDDTGFWFSTGASAAFTAAQARQSTMSTR